MNQISSKIEDEQALIVQLQKKIKELQVNQTRPFNLKMYVSVRTYFHSFFLCAQGSY